MADEKLIPSDYTFLVGAVRYKDLIYFALQYDKVDINLDPHFYPAALDGSQWGIDSPIEWTPVSMTISRSPIEQMVTVSEDGEVFCIGSGNKNFEKITCHGASPIDRGGPIRSVRNIDKCVYAVGMKRQVYRRSAPNTWDCIDSGVYSTGTQVVGFEAIDGYSEDKMYAVGWEGQIWIFNGADWIPVDSPTNLILMDVCCAGDGYVYACGQMGTLIAGKDDEWSLIETNLTENIWSMIWFDDTLFLAAYSGIYKLIGDHIERVNFKGDIPGTFYHLSAADGLLCSIGGKDVMGFDGRSWFRIR